MAKKYVLGPSAARKFVELLRGKGEVSRRAGVASELAFDSEYVAPFTVQWAQSADDGAGAWIIWLPSGSLVYRDGVAVDVRAGLTAVGGDYPSGWFLLTVLAGDATTGSVYLVVHQSSSSGGGATAEFTTSPSSASGDLTVLVATVSGRMAMQSLTSAISLGGAGAAAEDRGCFRIEETWADPDEGGDRVLQHTFGNRYFRIGDYIQQCFDSPAIETMLSNGNTVAALQIAYSASGGGGLYTASIVGFADVAALIAASADRTRQLMPLYKFAAVSPGSSPTVTVEVDFRNAPMSQEFELPII